MSQEMKDMDELRERLECLASNLGLDLLGVADLKDAKDFIQAKCGAHIVRFPRAVSIGVRLLDAVVDELYRHETLSVIFTYRGLYNSVNATLDRAALLLAKEIQESGFDAYPIPASQEIDPSALEGAFSHKLAAHLSGLGWIGKSCLLITPDYGPRVRLATVLTDARLEPGHQLQDKCGSCTRCVDICPVKAFARVPFNADEHREVRFKAHLCRDYTDRRAQRLGEGICGLCVYVCPHGAKRRPVMPLEY